MHTDMCHPSTVPTGSRARAALDAACKMLKDLHKTHLVGNLFTFGRVEVQRGYMLGQAQLLLHWHSANFLFFNYYHRNLEWNCILS